MVGVNEDIARSVASLVRDELKRNIARTQVECIEDAKTAKFCLYFIWGLVSGRRKIWEMPLFPLGEFHDEEMNDVFETIVDCLKKKEGE